MTGNGAPPFQAIFRPRVLAVVGVPRGAGKNGRLFLEAQLHPGFKGRLFAVNPGADEILGVPCYPTVSAIPERPDLAIVVTPTEAAIEVVRDCGRAGVPAAALFTAGFGELGTDEGRAREQELLRAAREGNVRLIGPNCMGVYCPASGVSLFPDMPAQSGAVGLISQSGSLCNFIVAALTARGHFFSQVVSVGNQTDLEISDFLEFYAHDPATRVIAAYLEGAKDGRRLRVALTRAAARKPVVIWKAGRTTAGARAAASHTGSLAGSGAVWAGLLRQAGAVQVREQDELVDTVTALLSLTPNAGERMAIVTGPGGPAVSAADACEEAGLRLAALGDETLARLRPLVAAAGTSLRNPVDVGLVLGGAVEAYGAVARIVGEDDGVDALLIIGGSRDQPSAFLQMLAELRRSLDKPVLHVAIVGESDRQLSQRVAAAGVGVFPSAERALRAYARARRAHADVD